MTPPLAKHVNVPVRQFGVPDGHSFFVNFELQVSKESSLVQVKQLRQLTKKRRTLVSNKNIKNFFPDYREVLRTKTLQNAFQARRSREDHSPVLFFWNVRQLPTN